MQTCRCQKRNNLRLLFSELHNFTLNGYLKHKPKTFFRSTGSLYLVTECSNITETGISAPAHLLIGCSLQKHLSFRDKLKHQTFFRFLLPTIITSRALKAPLRSLTRLMRHVAIVCLGCLALMSRPCMQILRTRGRQMSATCAFIFICSLSLSPVFRLFVSDHNNRRRVITSPVKSQRSFPNSHELSGVSLSNVHPRYTTKSSST